MNKSTQLARIEHKLNLLMEALQSAGILLKDLPPLEGIQQDRCPVCKAVYSVTANFGEEHVSLSCNCRLPLTITKGISTLMENNHGTRKPDLSSDSPQESDGDS